MNVGDKVRMSRGFKQKACRIVSNKQISFWWYQSALRFSADTGTIRDATNSLVYVKWSTGGSGGMWLRRDELTLL